MENMGMNATIDIVAACDNKFAQHARVMIQSVLESNSKRAFRVYLMTPEQHFSHGQKLLDAANPRCEIHLLKVPAQFVSHLRVTQQLSTATYYRLMMGRILPPDLIRVLYLDCDIIVRGDLQPLWQTELHNHVIAAAADVFANRNSELKYALGLPEGATYFNAGVMLIDL